MCYVFGMKYVSIRELRNRPGRVWSVLSKDDVVLTVGRTGVRLEYRVLVKEMGDGMGSTVVRREDRHDGEG
jgi:hypothetical protein